MGLRFNMHTPLWLYPVGIVAFFVVVMGLAVSTSPASHLAPADPALHIGCAPAVLPPRRREARKEQALLAPASQEARAGGGRGGSQARARRSRAEGYGYNCEGRHPRRAAEEDYLAGSGCGIQTWAVNGRTRAIGCGEGVYALA